MTDATRAELEAAREQLTLVTVRQCSDPAVYFALHRLIDAALAEVAPAETHCICRKLGGCKYSGGLPGDLRCGCHECHAPERREPASPADSSVELNAEGLKHSREGFVTAYDSKGRSVGCCGERWWRERLAEVAPAVCPDCEYIQHAPNCPTWERREPAKPVETGLPGDPYQAPFGERREPASTAGERRSIGNCCPQSETCDCGCHSYPARARPSPENPALAALHLFVETVDWDFILGNLPVSRLDGSVRNLRAAIAAAESLLKKPEAG